MSSSRRALLSAVLTAGLLLSFAPASGAAVRTVSYRSPGFTLEGFHTLLPKVRVTAPDVDGYITQMHVRLEYANGRQVSIRQVMLHHIVFINDGTTPREFKGSCEGRFGQPFYGTGEEHEQLFLPKGYGYPVQQGDRWRMQTMLMSHSLPTHKVYVRYVMRIVTGKTLTPVRPYWIRASGCFAKGPSYTVPGNGAPGSTDDQTWTWRVPISGHIVAAGGHLHGGARGMTLNDPTCGNRVDLDTNPLYAPPSDLVYRIRPILHEPGPVSTRYFLSEKGISVRQGQKLVIHGLYDDQYPRARVMSIMHIYIAPGKPDAGRCPALPGDRREMLLRRKGSPTPPYVKVPLNMIMPSGKIGAVDTLPGKIKQYSGNATVLVNSVFTPNRISIPSGATLTWHFNDVVAHSVLFANGPSVTGSPTLSQGSKTVTLTRPGRYQLFCYLHPVTMQEEVFVRAKDGQTPATSRDVGTDSPDARGSG